MMCPEYPPCTLSRMPDAVAVLLYGTFGLMVLSSVVLALKGWEIALSIRERRLKILEQEIK